MTMTKWVSLVAMLALASAGLVGAADAPDPAEVAKRLLKAHGAVAVAHKARYGGGIDDMWLGYDEAGVPVTGVASRQTKTYAEALAMIAVTPADGVYKVVAAEIPTVGSFHGKSQSYAKDALKDITGRVFEGSKEARGLVDAVSGATKYYKAIYVSYALMASKVIEELKAKPDWPREPIAAE